jgi:hypothetical protein
MTYYAFEDWSGRTLTRCVIAVNDSSKLPSLFGLRKWKLEREIDEHGEQPDWFNLSEVQAEIDRQGYWIKDYDHAAVSHTVTRKSSSKS